MENSWLLLKHASLHVGCKINMQIQKQVYFHSVSHGAHHNYMYKTYTLITYAPSL